MSGLNDQQSDPFKGGNMILYGKRWPEDFSNRFFIGQHTIDKDQNDKVPDVLKGIKPRQIVTQLADIGCDTLYFYMSCHLGNCYYPTRVRYGRVHSGIGKRDVFGEVADECVKRKVALVAVYEFAHLHYCKDWPKAPEDWKHYVYNDDGTRSVKGLCWNTGYGDFFLSQVEEVFSQYPVAGLFVDMLDYPGLNLCPGCKKRFQQDMNKEPPDQKTDINSPLYKEYRMWTFREEARYLKHIRQFIRKFVPGSIVVNNYHWLQCEDLYEIQEAMDFASTDPGIGFGSGTANRCYHSPQVFRTLSRGKAPFDILYDNVVCGLLEISPRDPYLGVSSVSLAHGGYPCPCSMWDKNGHLNPAAVGLAKDVYKHINRAKKWVLNNQSLKGAGIYLSQESEYFYGSPGEKIWRRTSRYLNSFHGALLMLQQEHLLADVLIRNQLSELAAYKVIYLPNTACLSEAEVAAFREYVRNGGTIVASYRASLCDEWGNQRKNFALADVFGVDWCGEKIEPYLALQMNVKTPRDYPFLPWENPSVSVNESALIVKARQGARVIANLHDRYRPNTDPKQCRAFHNAFVVKKPVGPAIVENKYGKGRSIYFAPKIFSTYAYKGVPEIRKLAGRWLVKKELSNLPLTLTAPSSVEMTAFARPQEAKWIIHLVNFQSAPGRMLFTELPVFSEPDDCLVLPLTEDVLPVYNLSLTMRTGARKIKNVRLALSGKNLKTKKTGSGLAVIIPKLHIHEIIEVNFAKPWEAEEIPAPGKRLLPMIHCPVKNSEKSGASPAVPTAKTESGDASGEVWDGFGMGQTGKTGKK